MKSVKKLATVIRNYNEKLDTIIKNFENHPNIMKIKSKYAIEKFSVKPVTVKGVENIKYIPNNKASGGTSWYS